MKKVYQKIISKTNGDCMRATVASLFEKELEEVPDFLSFGTRWWSEMRTYFEQHGYFLFCFNPQKDIELTKTVLQVDEGINGYWAATVDSYFFGPEVTHAVIIDKDMNVVHDPNPNNIGHVYTEEDIISIDMCSDKWSIELDGTIKVNYGKS